MTNKYLVSVSPNTSADTALELLKKSNLSIVPVIDKEKLVGTVTHKDLEKNQSGTVKKAMLKPFFVEKDSDVENTIRYLMKHGLPRVPVVDSKISMRCIGTVSASELLAAKKSKNNKN